MSFVSSRVRRAFSALLLLTGLLFAVPVAAIGVGTIAPEIGASDLSGRAVSMASLKGKVVMVDFWASWCAPCKQELPVLDALYKKYRGKGFEIIGVNQDESAESARKFLSSQPLSFPIVHDRGRAVANRYAPSKMPSSFLIDRKGIVRYVHGGFKSDDRPKLEAQISELLAK